MILSLSDMQSKEKASVLSSVCAPLGRLFEDKDLVQAIDRSSAGSFVERTASSLSVLLNLFVKHKKDVLFILSAMTGKNIKDIVLQPFAQTLQDAKEVLDVEFLEYAGIIRAHGPDRIPGILYRYGAPPTMQALSALLCEQEKEEAWEVYTASLLWVAAKAWYKDFPYPNYIDLITGKVAPPDNRSAEEIIEDLFAKLDALGDTPMTVVQQHDRGIMEVSE